MRTVLFATDYGSGLGDLAAFLPIAGALRRRGWHVVFAVPHDSDALELAASLIESAGYRFFEVAGAPDKNASSLAERIAGIPSFASADILRHALDFWFTQLRRLEPAVVVSGRAVLATVAATLANLPCCAVDTGSFHDHEALTAVTDEPLSREGIATAHVLAVANAALERNGPQVFRTLSDLYRIERVVRLAPRALLAGRPTALRDCVGASPAMSCGERAEWPRTDIALPRIFAYIEPRLANAAAILEVLGDPDASFNVIASVPGISEAMRRRVEREHLSVVDTPVDIAVLLEQADAVVCHAGSSLVAQALSMGKPLLLAPATNEQQQCAVAAMRIHAALLVLPNSDKERIREQLDRLLAGTFAAGRSYPACARALARSSATAEPDAIAASIEASAGGIAQDVQADRTLRSGIQPRNEVFADYDVIFLSYDEPHADERWGVLARAVPYAQRIHGVSGFDAAHKAAAAASRTERFILVDGDNVMDERFFEVRARVPALFADSIWQWCSVNNVTGLAYPFGGVKIWTRSRVMAMRTHEACATRDAPLATDFWAMPGYHTFRRVFSTNVTNDSPHQAFRAAFREGCKLVSWNGLVRTPHDFVRIAGMPQSRRALVWMSVGADVPNGLWSLLGARLGFLCHFQGDFDPAGIRAYQQFESYWRAVSSPIIGEEQSGGGVESEALAAAVARAGQKINALLGKPLAIDMNAEQSARFKQVMKEKLADDVPLFKPFGLNDGFNT
ncbi:glycosyltransferase [Paraburkholderia caledonica]|uniref:UDP:flavonoid glycosyltransferase YjiC (YdhE family) n=1 Tax=Paraburkholderia caledonica TaxID=134536 RepID=A0AB73IML9_9BURK|nr:UDP:flavonoid glycosyltransferase YjiC (YdhE family) [Paraburkholderia caledonica]